MGAIVSVVQQYEPDDDVHHIPDVGENGEAKGIDVDDVEDDIPEGPEDGERDGLVGMEDIVSISFLSAHDNKARDPSEEVGDKLIDNEIKWNANRRILMTKAMLSSSKFFY